MADTPALAPAWGRNGFRTRPTVTDMASAFTDPVFLGLIVVIVVFFFFVYLMIRRTVVEFREGYDGGRR